MNANTSARSPILAATLGFLLISFTSVALAGDGSEPLSSPVLRVITRVDALAVGGSTIVYKAAFHVRIVGGEEIFPPVEAWNFGRALAATSGAIVVTSGDGHVTGPAFLYRTNQTGSAWH